MLKIIYNLKPKKIFKYENIKMLNYFLDTNI